MGALPNEISPLKSNAAIVPLSLFLPRIVRIGLNVDYNGTVELVAKAHHRFIGP